MSKKILVADNDQLLVALLQDALEARGYQVLHAFDGMEALDHARREVPDYIVLDLIMPKVDGTQVCRQLKGDPKLQSIPIIILTGTAPEASHRLTDIGADAYIAKRQVGAMLQDLFQVLETFEQGTVPLTWPQEVKGQGDIQPRRIVTELLAHAAHQNVLLQNLGEGILFLDPFHRILYVNSAGAALFRRHESELIGASLSTILGAGGGDPLLQALRALASREGLATERLIYAYRDHTYHVTITNLLEGGWTTGQLLLIRDVTPLFRRIQELATLNELATLLNSTLDLDALLSLLMGRIQSLMGVEACSLLLKDEEKDELVFRIALGEHGEAVQGRRLQVGQGIAGWVFRQGSPLIVPDVRRDPRFYPGVDHDTGFTTKDMLCVPLKTRDKVIGAIQLLNRVADPAFNEDDMNLLSALAAHAATAIENAQLYTRVKGHAEELERKVEERTRQLQEAVRRAEEASQHKSAFLTNMSHELRTPLNSILGFSELLEDRQFGPLNEKQQRYVHNIWTSGKHLLTLINDILDLSKVEAGKIGLKPEAFPLREALKAALNDIRPQAKAKDLELTLDVEACPPTLVADPTRFKQVLYNLLSNAVKFTPDGGRVAVTARSLPSERVEITVEDTGIGIKAEDLPRLFQPFTQLDAGYSKRYQGTGLGLLLTKRLVELHGGEIRVESAGEGQGSAVTVTLPLRPSWESRPRLLLVDDDVGLGETLTTALQDAGYAVEVLTDGQEALARVVTRPPDLLLLDLQLSGCDGREILATLRAQGATQRLPIIVFTGMEGITEAEIKRRGAQEFLTKPFSTTVLLQVIGRLLDHGRGAFSTHPPLDSQTPISAP